MLIHYSLETSCGPRPDPDIKNQERKKLVYCFAAVFISGEAASSVSNVRIRLAVGIVNKVW